MSSLGLVRLTTTNRFPSGDHRNEFTPFFRCVTSCASPPSKGRIQSCGRGSSAALAGAGSVFRVERKARRDPSGLQPGELELKPSAVSRRGDELPSAATAHTDDLRRLAF